MIQLLLLLRRREGVNVQDVDLYILHELDVLAALDIRAERAVFDEAQSEVIDLVINVKSCLVQDRLRTKGFEELWLLVVALDQSVLGDKVSDLCGELLEWEYTSGLGLLLAGLLLGRCRLLLDSLVLLKHPLPLLGVYKSALLSILSLLGLPCFLLADAHIGDGVTPGLAQGRDKNVGVAPHQLRRNGSCLVLGHFDE